MNIPTVNDPPTIATYFPTRKNARKKLANSELGVLYIARGPDNNELWIPMHFSGTMISHI